MELQSSTNSLLLDEILINPLGGGQDDWPRLNAFVNSLAYKKTVVMGPGTWLCKSPSTLLAGVSIRCAPGVTIISSMTPTGGPGGTARTVFFASADVQATPPHIISTTLAANTILGANTISTTASFFVGDYIEIYNDNASNVAQNFKVLKVTGGGPYTVTLDAPILFPDAFLAAGSHVVTITPVSDINISGGGAIITGTGDRAIEIANGRNCLVKDFNITPTSGMFTSIACSFDVGTVGCIFNNIQVDCGSVAGGTVAAAGIAVESGYDVKLRYCRVINGTIGFFIPDSRCSEIINPVSENCTYGFQFTAGGTGQNGAMYNDVIDGKMINCVYGLNVNGPYNVIDGMKFINCSIAGSYTDSSTNISGTGKGGLNRLVNCTWSGNAKNGILGTAASATSLTDVEYVNPHFVEDGYGAANIWSYSGACKVKNMQLDNSVDYGGGGSNGCCGVYVTTDKKVTIDGLILNLPASPANGMNGVISQSVSANTIIELNNTQCTGGYFGIYFYANSGRLIKGQNVNFSSAATPQTINSGCTVSWRTPVGAGNYVVTVTDVLIAKTAITGGGDGISLPASLMDGRLIVIKDEAGTAGTNAITVTPVSGTIDGAANYAINTNYASITVYSNGTNWFIE